MRDIARKALLTPSASLPASAMEYLQASHVKYIVAWHLNIGTNIRTCSEASGFS
jgi:hypothetical protein